MAAVSIAGIGWRALVVWSIAILFVNSPSVQAQSSTVASPDDFPIGLVLEYDLTEKFFMTANQMASTIRYEVSGWVQDDVILEVDYSGGWSGSGTWYLKLPQWVVVDSNGTPMDRYLIPLWINTTCFRTSQLTIPSQGPLSRTYNLTPETRQEPERAFNCWRCGTSWNDQGTDFFKNLYYEVDLGVLVEESETSWPSIGPPDYGMGGYELTRELAESNIQSFIPPKGLGDLISPATGLLVWILLSLAVLAVPVKTAYDRRPAVISLEEESCRGGCYV